MGGEGTTSPFSVTDDALLAAGACLVAGMGGHRGLVLDERGG